jgi:hypothetical protein
MILDGNSPVDPPLTPDDRFDAYRCMLASPRDEEIHWWYFGTAIVTLAGLPPLPAINAATLMVYRTETLSKDRFAIHWDEIGYFADYVTSEPVDAWVNPVTGVRVATPQGFAEGPARYEVVRSPQGVAVSLTQPGALDVSIDVSWREADDRVWLIQEERKTRGFPDVDGNLPDPKSTSGFAAVTRLAFIDRRGADGASTQGIYAFALAGAPPWMGLDPALQPRATVHGVIVKASPASPPRPESLTKLRQMFPDFFARHPL